MSFIKFDLIMELCTSRAHHLYRGVTLSSVSPGAQCTLHSEQTNKTMGLLVYA